MILCGRCNDVGQYLGTGMMIIDCDLCSSDDKNSNFVQESFIEIDKESESYKKAIKDIMRLDKTLSRKDAVVIFESEYKKNG